MTAGYRLYGRRGSGSFAVQVALEEARVGYEKEWVEREPAAVDAYRRIFPTGKVPGLQLPDGTRMFESAAILLHLASAHPDALGPAPGTPSHPAFLQWMIFLSANTYEAVLRMYYSSRYSARGESDVAAISEQARTEFIVSLELIAPSLDPYVLGPVYSIADVYLYMLVTWWPDDREQLFAKLPALRRHAGLVSSRPAVAKVEADHATLA